MGRQIERLKAAALKWLPPRGTPYPDGSGLYFQVTGENARSWLYRYEMHGRERWMGLGPFPAISLAAARKRAREARAMRADGRDPIEARDTEKTAERLRKAGTISFEEAAGRYIKAKAASWKNTTHRKQWNATLATYAYPVIGKLPVSEIETPHVLKVIEPIWAEKAETASRVRGRIEAILDWATVRKYRHGENPARWRGHLQHALTERPKARNQPSLPYEDIPSLFADLRQRGGVTPRALELTILAATRTGETIGAQWPEVDLKSRIWTIPGARTKSGREHRIPLTPRMLEILKALPREETNPFVFIGGKAGAGLSNMSMLSLLKEMRPGFTVHGFRSSFRTWAREQTNFPREVAEAALAHIIKDKTEAAYARGDVLEKRRRLMAAWSDYCASTPAKGARVVNLRAAT